MYKNNTLIALFLSLIWLAFIFAAFLGFSYWYTGFVFFFSLTLGILNYRHQTFLWYLKNRWKKFLIFYLFLLVLGFIGDQIVGIQIAELWVYPAYNSIWNWILLYTVIYPAGGISLIELTFFLGNIFKEKFTFSRHENSSLNELLVKTDRVLGFILFILIISAFISSQTSILNIPSYWLVGAFLSWLILATFQLFFHIRHPYHWLAIILATLGVSVFFHEIPNIIASEWIYHDMQFWTSFSNIPVILGIQLWVFVGWYFMLILMLQVWKVTILRKN